MPVKEGGDQSQELIIPMEESMASKAAETASKAAGPVAAENKGG